MKSYEEATRHPHRYLMLDLKPTTDGKQRLKSSILPGENAVLTEYFKKNSYQQPPIVNALYNSRRTNATDYASTTVDTGRESETV